MPTATCPHCGASQEVVTSATGAEVQISCGACAKPLFVRGASAGLTQKLGEKSPAASIAPSPPEGTTQAALGPYEIRGIIGAGGMGIVYQGWDARLNRSVAVKTLKPELAKEPAFCERFLREARAVASLSHPNVTQIYYIGEEAGRPFFAMEFLEGKPLDALLRDEGKISPSRATDLIRQAALGLKAAAARGVIHRDIKPSNLVLTREGAVKVTDFGLAKMVVADSGLTLTGEVLGSPNYVAPEQASGAPADLRSDIYSLGATLYELLTGRPPFEGPTPVSIILKHVREPLRSPRQFSPDLPVPLVTLTQRMLAKRPEDRPRDYEALIRELDRLLTPIGMTGGSTRSAAIPAVVARNAASTAGGSFPGTWILIPILVLGAVAFWGFLRQSRTDAGSATSISTAQASLSPVSAAAQNAARSPEGEPQQPGGSPAFTVPPPAPPTTVLSTTAQVAPPQLGARGTQRRRFELPPELSRLREAARANLQFAENTHEITLDGRLRIKGSVYNAGVAVASDIKVRITLTDASGQEIGFAEASLSPPYLSSQQAGTFEAYFPDPHRSISIKAELSWNS